MAAWAPMTREVEFPGRLRIRAGGQQEQARSSLPDWGVYADTCWSTWPGEMLEWPDFGVPADDDRVLAAIVGAIGRARDGQDVLVGCRGGVGRTGTILAVIAIGTGVPPDQARAWVRHRYHPAAVETDEQARWVLDVAGQDTRLLQLGDEARRREIRKMTACLRDQAEAALVAGDPLPILVWAIPGELAITQRPLRAHPDPGFGASRQSLPEDARPAIDAWIDDLKSQGIRSVIVLTSDKELAHYDAPTGRDGGLLQIYRDAGLEVLAKPADDPAHDVTAAAAFKAAVDDIAADVASELEQLRRPAVMQCSAAIDRSPPVAARVAFHAQVTPGWLEGEA